MANTKIIKRRIKSAKNISQITRAMEMVAASKMRRSQNQAISSRPYSEGLRRVLFSLLENQTTLQHKLMQENKSPAVAMLLVSTNKGLCGSLNTNLFRQLFQFTGKAEQKPRFITVGKKGKEFLLRRGGEILADFSDLKENVYFEDTIPISHFLMDMFLKEQVGKVFISYPNFVSTIIQRPNIVQILPVKKEDILKTLGELEKTTAEEESKSLGKEYLIEPSKKQIAGWLLPYFVELEVYHYILEARAAEHSARMVAMKNASDNAKEIVSDLTLLYNKARQNQITNQIAEVATASLVIGK
jgi:F-type H+-transporting ATPase subunit gamma